MDGGRAGDDAVAAQLASLSVAELKGVLAATTSFSVVFLAVVFFVVPDLDFAVFEAVSAFLAPSSPDVRSEGVVLPEGCFPEGSPPPRRVFFVAIPRV